MALPQLNAAPKYELKVPSTGQEIYYRPFLVKEQKVLLIASESQDKKQIIKGILDTVQSCVESDIDVGKLTTFDIDYIFTQIRGKSVGEKVDLRIKCTECGEYNEVEINIDDVQAPVADGSKIIKLTDQISVKLAYPSYAQFLRNSKILDSKSETESVMEIIIACMESIQTEEDNILLKDEPREEIVKFLDSMTADQFEKITEFVQKMPTMSHNLEFKCTNCEHDNEVELKGIDDFF